jgi:hypothetical protein
MEREPLETLLGVDLEDEPLLVVGTERWRPSYGDPASSTAVHVCETAAIGRSISRRIRAFADEGFRVIVALPRGATDLDLESQDFLLASPVAVVTPSDVDLTQIDLHDDFKTVVVEQGIYLDPALTRRVVSTELNGAMLVEGTDRGQALERALSLAVSQVPGWRVKELNLRTANEELDIVVGNNSAQSPWNGSPYILVESKNWSSNVDRVEYDAFHMKVKERGGFCRLGLFVAAAGFSGGFYQRAEHHGSEGFSIVPITAGWLSRRLESSRDVEDALIQRVEEVVLARQWEEDGGS